MKRLKQLAKFLKSRPLHAAALSSLVVLTVIVPGFAPRTQAQITAPISLCTETELATLEESFGAIAGDVGRWRSPFEGPGFGDTQKENPFTKWGIRESCYNAYVTYVNEERELADEVLKDVWVEQERILKNRNTIDKARKLFSQGRNNELTDENYDDIQRDFVGHYDDGNDGFKTRPNTAPQLKKFAGNPWFQWSSENGHILSDYRVPEGDGGAPVRFVLAEVNTRSNELGVEGALTGDRAGTAWIFRNEYNPSIAVVIWQRDAVDGAFLFGVSGLVAGSGSNWRRLVYAPGCEDVTGNDSDVRMSNVSAPNDFNAGKWLGDDPGSDTVKNQIKRYKLKGSTCNTTTGFFQDAIKQVMELIANALKALLTTIIGWVSGVVNVGALDKNPGLTSAWKTMRDFVNLIFILIMVVIALSNILRIDTDRYGVRALIPRLIFAVIAVNFSFIMVQILTNAAFIMSQPFLEQARELITNPPADGSLINTDGGFGNWVVAVLLFIGVIVGLLVLLLFFVVRILMIWFLTATSPFVFLFMVLPMTRSIAGSWFKQAMKWIFMAPIAFVFLFIAAELITGGGDLAEVPENSDVADPSWLLKIAFFIAACIAAVLIPLKLGGEVMGRAASGARRAGRYGKGAGKMGAGLAGRTSAGQAAKAALEQRKAAKEQTAQQRGMRLRKGISDRMPGRTGQFVTGADRGQLAVQAAALEDKYGSDMQTLGMGVADQKMIAAGDTEGLKKRGLNEAAKLSENPYAQRAAAKNLAKNGYWGDKELAQHQGTGYQSLMKPVNPVMAAVDTNGNISPEGLEGIQSNVGYLNPQDARGVYWNQIKDYSDGKNGGQLQEAGRVAFSSVNEEDAKALVEHGGRNVIADDKDRAAFIQGIRAHGSEGAKREMNKQLSANKEKQGGKNKPLGPERLGQDYQADDERDRGGL